MGRLVDADRIIYHEIDEIGGEYEPYIGCSKSQIDNLPTIEAIPKVDYENRLKADMINMLTELQLEIEELDTPNNNDAYMTCSDIIQEKINKLKGAN